MANFEAVPVKMVSLQMVRAGRFRSDSSFSTRSGVLTNKFKIEMFGEGAIRTATGFPESPALRTYMQL